MSTSVPAPHDGDGCAFPSEIEIERRTLEAMKSLGPLDALIRVYRPNVTVPYHLEMSDDEYGFLLKGFCRLGSEDKDMGPIELANQIKVGWVIKKVNNISLVGQSNEFRKVTMKQAVGLLFLVFQVNDVHVEEGVESWWIRRPRGGGGVLTEGGAQVVRFGVGDEVEVGVGDPKGSQDRQWKKGTVIAVKEEGGRRRHDVAVGFSRGPFEIIYLDKEPPTSNGRAVVNSAPLPAIKPSSAMPCTLAANGPSPPDVRILDYIGSYTPCSIVMAPLRLRCWDSFSITTWPARIIHPHEAAPAIGSKPSPTAVQLAFLGLGGHHWASKLWHPRDSLTFVTIGALRNRLEELESSQSGQVSGQASPTTVNTMDLDLKVGLAWAVRLAEVEAMSVLKGDKPEISYKFNELELRCPWRCRKCMAEGGGNGCDCAAGLQAFLRQSANFEAKRRLCPVRYDNCPGDGQCGMALLVYLWAKECRGDAQSRLLSFLQPRELLFPPKDRLGSAMEKRRLEQEQDHTAASSSSNEPSAKRHQGNGATSITIPRPLQIPTDPSSPRATLGPFRTGVSSPLAIPSPTSPRPMAMHSPGGSLRLIPVVLHPKVPHVLGAPPASPTPSRAGSASLSIVTEPTGQKTAAAPSTTNTDTSAITPAKEAANKAALPNIQLLSESELRLVKYQEVTHPVHQATSHLQPDYNYFRQMLLSFFKASLTAFLQTYPPVEELVSYVEGFGNVMKEAVKAHQFVVEKAKKSAQQSGGSQEQGGDGANVESLELAARNVQTAWQNYENWVKLRYPDLRANYIKKQQKKE